MVGLVTRSAIQKSGFACVSRANTLCTSENRSQPVPDSSLQRPNYRLERDLPVARGRVVLFRMYDIYRQGAGSVRLGRPFDQIGSSSANI